MSYVKVPTRVPAHNLDPAEHFRAEISQRTAAGETCEQIAAALRAKGVEITNKTISRRRVEWGLRKRPPHKLAGTKIAKPRPKKSTTQNARINARKSEIEARTQRGETAEQIADALLAQGYELKKGSSTIMRLQTVWGLIEPSEDRARGRSRNSASGEPRTKRVKVLKEPKVSKREMEREANKQQQTQTMHYPTNCSFGPKRREQRLNGVTSTHVDADADAGAVMDLDPDLDSSPALSSPTAQSHTQPQLQHQQPALDVSAEIMSVDFLVDLANSTLVAAQHLKAMLLAYQERRPVDEFTMLPPSLDDLSTARRKVREAAGVMLDLAAEPGTQQQG